MSNTNDKIVELLNNIEKNLENINKNIRLIVISAMPNINENFSNLLDTNEKKLAYNLTDGKTSARIIANNVGVSISTINRWWRSWINSGILDDKKNTKNRYPSNTISLDELDLEIIDDNEDIFSNVNTKNKLRKILNSKIFKTEEIVQMSSKIFNKKYVSYVEDKDVINQIIDLFNNGNKRQQLMFVQYLRQKYKGYDNDMVDYFEFWEKNIKREI